MANHNAVAAARAAVAIDRAYADYDGELPADTATKLYHLLTDILELCDRDDIDFDYVLAQVRADFQV